MSGASELKRFAQIRSVGQRRMQEARCRLIAREKYGRTAHLLTPDQNFFVVCEERTPTVTERRAQPPPWDPEP